MKKIIFFVILFLFLFRTPVLAGRGCCSWHGGQCGCNNGRTVCCDGSLSPSCTCYSPPKPSPTPFKVTASIGYEPDSNNTNTVLFTLNAPVGEYSAVISKCNGCDPGPLIDFNTNIFSFTKVDPGQWYVNVKRKFADGGWSIIYTWTVDVPIPVQPTPTQTYVQTNSENGDAFLGLTVLSIFGIVFLVGAWKIFAWFLKLVKKQFSK